MRDINEIYRRSVAGANSEHTKSVAGASKAMSESIRAAMSMFRTAMETFEAALNEAAAKHLEAVSASEIAWTTGAELKLANFQGVDEVKLSDHGSKNLAIEQSSSEVAPDIQIRLPKADLKALEELNGETGLNGFLKVNNEEAVSEMHSKPSLE